MNTNITGAKPSKKVAVVHLSNAPDLKPNRGGWRRSICGIATRAAVKPLSVEHAKGDDLCEACHLGYLTRSSLRAHIVPFVVARQARR